MTLLFENETDVQLEFDAKKLAGTVIERALEKEAFPYEAQVSLTLVDNESMRALNRENRGIDSVTDVLSFPMLSLLGPADYTGMEDDDGNFDYETGEALLGDIVICVPRMMEQAEQYGHAVQREFAFLIAHSMLHLVSYDHLTEEEERVMFLRQEEILSSLGITR